MNRLKMRDYAKSLVDSTFDDTLWNTWLEMGYSAVLSSIPQGFTRSEILAIVNGEAELPTDFIAMIKLEGTKDMMTFYPLLGDYRVVDKKLYLNTEEKFLRVTYEYSPESLSTDSAEPKSLPAAYHDIPCLYAAMQSQIKDEETENYKNLDALYRTRLAMMMDKLSKANTRGKNFQMKSYR